MEAVTDVVFRRVVKQAGAPDIFFTEFANATGWVHAGDKAIAGRLIKTDDEQPLMRKSGVASQGIWKLSRSTARNLALTELISIWDVPPNLPLKAAVRL